MKLVDEYKSIASGIAKLLNPFGEVVLHDLKTKKISAIFNNISKRKIGDPSFLEKEFLKDLPKISEVYEKINFDGRKLKSISIALRNERDQVAALLCINFDVSDFERLNIFAQIQEKISKPRALFKEDWQDRINSFIGEFLKKSGSSIGSLDREQKKQIIISLEKNGAFKGKNAATYIANILKLSRATVYNYLSEKTS